MLSVISFFLYVLDLLRKQDEEMKSGYNIYTSFDSSVDSLRVYLNIYTSVDSSIHSSQTVSNLNIYTSVDTSIH